MSSPDFLLTVRSVRGFSDRPVPDGVLHDVLEAARWTGSAKNGQPWELLVIRDREHLRELSTCGWFAAHVAEAQVAIALLMEGSWEATGYDEGRLAERVLLAAWAEGVGGCIATIFPEHQDRARDLLGVPPTLRLTTVVSLGYPDAGPEPKRRRKPFDQLVSWERYGRRSPER